MCPHMGETLGGWNNSGTIVGYSDTIVLLELESTSVKGAVELLREVELLSSGLGLGVGLTVRFHSKAFGNP